MTTDDTTTTTTKTYRCYIFDVDGTLVETISHQRFREIAGDWQWLPGRLEKIRELRDEEGAYTATASNQGGVAYGYLDEAEMHAEMIRLGNEGQFDTMRVCYNMPGAPIPYYNLEDAHRKPGPLMLIEIMQELEVSPHETLMVGDRKEDMLAARAAGCDFIWASIFFGDPPHPHMGSFPIREGREGSTL